MGRLARHVSIVYVGMGSQVRGIHLHPLKPSGQPPSPRSSCPISPGHSSRGTRLARGTNKLLLTRRPAISSTANLKNDER